MASHLKKRALFIFCIMFPPLVLIDYLGYSSIVASGVLGGIAGGLAVVLFPETPQPQPGKQLHDAEQD